MAELTNPCALCGKREGTEPMYQWEFDEDKQEIVDIPILVCTKCLEDSNDEENE